MSRYRVVSFQHTPLAADMYSVVAEIEVDTEARALTLMHSERRRLGCWPDVIRLKDGAIWNLDSKRFEAGEAP